MICAIFFYFFNILSSSSYIIGGRTVVQKVIADANVTSSSYFQELKIQYCLSRLK